MYPAPLLSTKFHIPPQREDFVPRPHLIERLNAGLNGKLILVSAPAGFGKSSLLGAWDKQASLPFAWVSLDDEDNAPTRFLSYLIATLQKIDANIGAALLPALQSLQPPAPLSTLPYLINDIHSSDEIILVLDDYHVIKSQAVHNILAYLLQHLPPNLHLVIATRADPPLPLARLRGRQQLIELRTNDLRFSDEEADQFFNSALYTESLSFQDIAALNARTEGWITGMQMAMLSMQGLDDKRQFISSFTGSNRYILDYLLEEVLDHQTEELCSFLLKTSILDQLSAGLCTTITGEINSQELLEKVERTNLFLIHLDDQREWFRYHHLFADLLHQCLIRKMPEIIPELHQLASIWYEENGFLGEAIDQALAIEDCKRTVRLLKQYIRSIWEYGDQTRLTRWLASLPEEEICKQSTLLAHHAFALCFSGQFEAAEAQLLLAEKYTQPEDSLFQGMAATVRAFYSLYSNEIELAAEYANQALEQLPEAWHIWRALALSIYGDVRAYHGHVPTCEKVWTAGLNEAQRAGSTFFELWISAKLVFTQRRLGKLRQAAKTFESQTQRAFKAGYNEMAIAGGLYSVYGDVLVEWNQVDEAIEQIRRGLSLSERQNYMAGVAWSSIAMINAHYARGGGEAAGKAIHQLEERLRTQKLPAWTNNWLTAWQVRLLLDRGELERASLILEARNITLNGKFSYPNEVEYLALARQLIVKENFIAAENLLSRLDEHLMTMGWTDKLIEARILKAISGQRQGKMEEALGLFAGILEIAQPEGYKRIFLNEGSPMAQLLYKAAKAGIFPEYASYLLTTFPSQTESDAPSSKVQKTLIDPISPREMEVLHQLTAGSTNQEIALILHIAPGTVKNHLKKIYGKLGVHNRTQAASRARTLGLLK